MASAGSLFGIAMAARLADTCGAVLLIAAEKMSAVIETPPLDRNTAILFGDGAGACLIHPSEGFAGLREFALHSDGAFHDALRLEFGEPIHMDGRSVIMQAARKVPAAIREVLERSGRSADSIAAFLMHQANQNLIVKIAQSIGVAPEKFYSNIARYGNTSSASMLIAASEWSDAGGFHKDDAVVFAAFGAGFHWGAVLAVGSMNMASLSVVIPAYNEEARLPPTLDTVVGFLNARPFEFAELIVVDDGSRDGTAALVESFARNHAQVRLLRNPGNRGKGFSIRHGMLEAKADWVLYTDADLSAPIEEFDKLLTAAQNAGARVAIGSRALDRSLVGVHQSAFRELSGRAFNVVMRVITGLPFRDTQCGFKLFERLAAREIFSRQVPGWFQLRRGGPGDREIARLESDRGSRGVEQRGRHQSRHVDRSAILRRPGRHPLASPQRPLLEAIRACRGTADFHGCAVSSWKFVICLENHSTHPRRLPPLLRGRRFATGRLRFRRRKIRTQTLHPERHAAALLTLGSTDAQLRIGQIFQMHPIERQTRRRHQLHVIAVRGFIRSFGVSGIPGDVRRDPAHAAAARRSARPRLRAAGLPFSAM